MGKGPNGSHSGHRAVVQQLRHLQAALAIKHVVPLDSITLSKIGLEQPALPRRESDRPSLYSTATAHCNACQVILMHAVSVCLQAS